MALCLGAIASSVLKDHSWQSSEDHLQVPRFEPELWRCMLGNMLDKHAKYHAFFLYTVFLALNIINLHSYYKLIVQVFLKFLLKY